MKQIRRKDSAYAMLLVVFCQLLLFGSSFQVPRCSSASRLPTTNHHGGIPQHQQQKDFPWSLRSSASDESLSDVDTIDTDKVRASSWHYREWCCDWCIAQLRSSGSLLTCILLLPLFLLNRYPRTLPMSTVFWITWTNFWTNIS